MPKKIVLLFLLQGEMTFLQASLENEIVHLKPCAKSSLLRSPPLEYRQLSAHLCLSFKKVLQDFQLLQDLPLIIWAPCFTFH